LARAHAILVTPDSKAAVVLSYPNGPGQASLLTAIRLVRHTVRWSVKAGDAERMAVTPDGRFIWLTDPVHDVVTVVRTATDRVVKRIRVLSFPWSLAITPDGKTVFVGASDPATGIAEVVPIATATGTAGAPILLGPDGGTVNAIAFTPDGRTAYLAVSSITGEVIPMSTSTRTLGTPVPVGPNPTVIVIARTRPVMYVLSSNYP
jgi:YVTN family beta-propeller protein